jgi:hypothetical protein
MRFETNFPKENRLTRQSIYGGEVYLASANRASRRIVAAALDLMKDVLDTEDLRHAHLCYDDAELFERLGNLRRTLYLDPVYHQMVRDVVADSGFDPDEVAFDPARLRVVLPGGHENPRAAPVYYPHRDTWYAHPQSLIVWWIPLHDLCEEETFRFYPESFDCPVPNDSEIFDYADWIKDGLELKIGWQKKDTGMTAGYPRALEMPASNEGVGFAPNAADNLVFAGGHYHKTLPQDFGTIRFSLDFRVVHLGDASAGLGAPNADNRSVGSTLGDYIQPR